MARPYCARFGPEPIAPACALPLESSASQPGTWPARLELVFERRERATRLVCNRHAGPLRLIRALPVADGSCEAVLVHPPGGLVDGDTLDIDVRVGASAHVLCTTPGAQKWYRRAAAHSRAGERSASEQGDSEQGDSARSPGAGSRVTTVLQVGAQAMLEWLPQPAIVYDGAHAEQEVVFDLAGDACLIAWECLVLGRRAMGERFRRGSLRQSLSLRIGGRLAWSERTVADAGARLFDSPLGWRGRCVAATVLAVGVDPPALLEEWRAILHGFESRTPALDAAATRLEPRLLLARLLADEPEDAMQAARALRAAARRAFTGTEAHAPRIWAT